MKITVAESAGFCFGVSRAVSMVEEKCAESKVYTYGPVIHNALETERLRKMGATILEDLSLLTKDDTIIIRSHGTSAAEEEEMIKSGATVFDATCPFVKRIHDIVHEHSLKGYEIVIIGDENHPEVRGISGRCRREAIVISHEEEIIPKLSGKSPLCVVAQTTANKKNYKNLIKIIKNTCQDVVFFDTICNATRRRQSEAESLSKESDIMIVIGDKQSRNTLKLAEVSEKHCKNVYHIENSASLTGLDFSGRIGITAGASAPDWIIKEVLKTMEENMAKTELSFAEELEKSLLTLNTGDVVTGTVIGITPTEVYVDLGYKADGVISASELSEDPALKPEDIVKIGDTIEAFVYRVSDVEGTVGLSMKKLKSIKGWEEIQKAFDEKQDLVGKVIEAVSGGVIATALGSRIFIPATLASDRYVSDLSTLVGKEYKIRLRDINRARRKIVGSIKDILLEEKEKLTKAFWEKIDAGQVEFDGTVKTITNFGAFVDLDGVDGLIHISQLSWNHIKHPSEVLSVGDKVKVTILDANRETGKISLGYRRDEDNPWTIAKSKFGVNDVVSVKVVRLTNFGAFVELIPGIDGLVHISQIANKRIEHPSSELSVGQEVEALITDIDWEAKKVALSIRALLPEEAPAPAVEEAKEEEIPEGTPAYSTEEAEVPAAEEE